MNYNEHIKPMQYINNGEIGGEKRDRYGQILYFLFNFHINLKLFKNNYIFPKIDH